MTYMNNRDRSDCCEVKFEEDIERTSRYQAGRAPEPFCATRRTASYEGCMACLHLQISRHE
jgi:hypothetical protein